MRVAFVHDWLAVSGGAEKVSRELLRLYDADVFSLVDFLGEEDRDLILHGKHARTTYVQHLPFARTGFRNYLPLFPHAMAQLDLRGYDLVLSASYAIAKGVRIHAGQKHVCYIHTPMRYAWVNEQGYLRDHGITGLRAWAVARVMARLRRWDVRTSARVDRFIANSHNVAQRVRRCYGRDADVVLPPVDPDLFPLTGGGERSHFLAASRLVPYKRVDRIVQAFARLPGERLIVVGDGPELHRLRDLAPANVVLEGHVEQRRLVELIHGAKALVCAADEDLGLTPLEAQACGTPTIGLGKGGYLETVIDGVSGVLFPDDQAGTIADAVRRFLARGVSNGPEALRAGVRPFFAEPFRRNVQDIIDQVMGHA